MIDLDYVIKGSPRAERAINRFIGRIENFEAFAPTLHRYLRDVVWHTFMTEGREIGESWPDYTGSEFVYGVIKAKLLGTQRHARKLRWADGKERLFPSLRSASHPEHVFKVEGASFTFGTRVPYARHHQEGRGRGPWWAGFPKIKQRRFLGLGRKHVANIRRKMARFVGI